jgi:stearoyl-CoA desaturase (Delta-9 desaturase)
MAPRDPTTIIIGEISTGTTTSSSSSLQLPDEVLSLSAASSSNNSVATNEQQAASAAVKVVVDGHLTVSSSSSSSDDDDDEDEASTLLLGRSSGVEKTSPPATLLMGQSGVDLVAWGWECGRGFLIMLPMILALESVGAFAGPYYWITCYAVGLIMHEVSFMAFIMAQYLLPFAMAGYLLCHGQYPTFTMLLWFLPINYFYVGVPMSVILHRYFAHHSYDTSRIFQFVIACLGCCAYQGGPLFWAAKHGKHHCHCDQPLDPHSAKQRGTLYAWLLWSMDPMNHVNTDYEYLTHPTQTLLVPEIIFIDRFYLIPPVLLLTAAELYFGRLTTVTLVYLPMMTCRLATLWFNVDFHPVVDEKTKVPIVKRCTAIDKYILSHAFVGESLHEDHHHVPNRARRTDLDLAWWVSLSWMEQIGLVWNCK